MSQVSHYPEVKQLNLPDIDRQILAFWQAEGIFEKSISTRSDAEPFIFFEGPPSTNGLPGIHHVMGRTIKDLYCRYQTLKGKKVLRKGGWDTHGLPIELNVEKQLNIRKTDIGTKISIAEYNDYCRKDALRYIDVWNRLTHRMGYWVDTENPYITYENPYIESVWWLLQQLHQRGLMYKGYTIQPYSPAAGTGLSSHELNLPGCYREVTDTSAVALFKVQHNEQSAWLFDSPAEDVRIAAWTTTPWTLPGNTALTVGGKIRYTKVSTLNPYTQQPMSVVLAEGLVGQWFGGKNQPAVVAQSPAFVGTALNGIRYKQLMPIVHEIEALEGATDAFRVILGDFVTTSDGTGVVHTAPSFGADDRRVASQNGIGTITHVDLQGKFNEQMGEFAHRYVKNYLDDPNYVNIDVDIAIYLKTNNKALNVQKYVHNYPHCWRTDKPVLYYPLDSWFIASSKMKNRMVELNETIRWKPASTGEGRFKNWLANLTDWNLSRSRYWGTPLPIWRTADGQHEICIGSLQQLETEINKANQLLGLQQSMPTDLHRPYIDDISLATNDGQVMRRETDLIDVWFDSGAMPYAQHHYPQQNPHLLDGAWQADFIAEGVDQTRGWFFTLHAIASMLFDKVSFKNVLSNGLLLDENGVKMSKRLGNIVDPFVAMDMYGTDAVRWYMMSNSNPWENLKFSWTKVWSDDAKTQLLREYSVGIEEVRNKFLGTLYNTYSFFALYANVDGFAYAEPDIAHADRPELDRWILSRLHSLVSTIDHLYTNYDATPATRLIQDFVIDDLSNWYVRLSRRRFWKGEYEQDKISAYQTLHQCLVTVCQLAAPVAPFITDFLYRHLTSKQANAAQSVHLTSFPIANTACIDTPLEERMSLAQIASSLALALRKKAEIRVRQPLQKILIPTLNAQQEAQYQQVAELILAEINVKELQLVNDTSGMVRKNVKPDLKKLGKKLGSKMKAVTTAIANLQQDDIRTLEQQGKLLLQIAEGETVEVQLDELLITSEDIVGWMVNSDKGVTVALDVQLTDELVSEGTARELINRLQSLRKTANLNLTDHLHLQLSYNPDIAAAVERHYDYICTETLADHLSFAAQLPPDTLTIEINGIVLHVAMQVV